MKKLLPEGLGERDKVEERVGTDEVMSGEWRDWDWEKESWEEEAWSWRESGEGDARSSDDAMAITERIDNKDTYDKVGFFDWGIYVLRFFRSNGLEWTSN